MVVQHSWAFDVHGHSAITVIPKLTLALDRINRPIAEPGILRKVAPVGSIEKFCRKPPAGEIHGAIRCENQQPCVQMLVKLTIFHRSFSDPPSASITAPEDAMTLLPRLMQLRLMHLRTIHLPLKPLHLKIAPILLPCLIGYYAGGLAQMTVERNTLTTASKALEAFKFPPPDYRSTPLWVWNDLMTPGSIDEGLADLQRHGIGGVFIHPRPGLITPYLSDEWISLCRHAVQTGKKLGMKVWIYDENSYPSGFAGGIVPERMPDAKRTGLKMTGATELPSQFDTRPFLVLAGDSSGFTDITSQLGARQFGPGEYRIFTLIHEEPKPWHGGFTYVDVMRPEVTREFIDVTMNAYKRAFGEEFGAVVPGVFQDEAEMRPASEPDAKVVNYTPAMFDRFKQKWGYDLRPSLPSLFEESGDWRRVRHNFRATLLDLFIRGWAELYYNYCTENNLKLTGHYWEHVWPKPVMNPDNMACAAYAHMPGIDVLMNEFRADVEGQFGNARIVKEIRSVANQLGKERTLSETYGASGWDLTFEDQKRIGDWEYALGVNFMDQHLSYVTIKGARKRDHPLSFSYHEPWWKFYGMMGDYFGRLSVALCAGDQSNRILVLEPTTTAWMYAGPEWSNPKVDAIGQGFQNFVNRLEAAQIEYDLGCEDIFRNHARVRGRHFVVGQRVYDLVVIPPGTENLDEATVALVRKYMANGGNVICCDETPGFINGGTNDRVKALVKEYPKLWVRAKEDSVLEIINRLSPPILTFRDAAGKTATIPMLFHHRRSLEDCEILFLANTDSSQYRSGQVEAPGRSCERWDPFTGTAAPYPCTALGERLAIDFSIPPGGSLLLCLRSSGEPVPPTAAEKWVDVPPRGPAVVSRVAPNVLTLDYCDITLGGKTEIDLYFYQAQQKAYQHHGLDRNPWDNAVQFKRTILDKDNFAPASGFEAAFHFSLAEEVNQKSMRAVVERPELFRIAVNGKPVQPLEGEWWLDKAFGVYDIGRLVTNGNNTLTVTSSPFTIHTELEPIYLLGDFILESSVRGFRILPSEMLSAGAWNAQGMPFYADGVSYTQSFDVTAGQLKSRRFAVQLGKWNGVVAHVTVNGKDAGVIASPPYELEVTGAMKAGSNKITVTVCGSLKNTLGPHHNNPPLGRAWPAQFQAGAKEGRPSGSSYSTVGYGMFENFVLRRTL